LKRGILPLVLFLSSTMAYAEEGDIEVGLLFGPGFFHVNSPQDPAGSTTFLYGSSFTGVGLMVGGAGSIDLSELLGLEVDLLFATTSVTGFAEDAGARREVTFGEDSVRLVLLPTGILRAGSPELRLGLGAELSVAVRSAVLEELVGIDPSDEEILTTTHSTWIHLVSQVAAHFDLGDFELPLVLRLGWNPFYPDTTNERFDGFQSADDPGSFRVGVDWYAAVFSGVRFSL
jgi:hypothetical protein